MELSKKNRDAIVQLAKSSDAQKLRELLQQQSGQVKQAAQAGKQAAYQATATYAQQGKLMMETKLGECPAISPSRPRAHSWGPRRAGRRWDRRYT